MSRGFDLRRGLDSRREFGPQLGVLPQPGGSTSSRGSYLQPWVLAQLMPTLPFVAAISFAES